MTMKASVIFLVALLATVAHATDVDCTVASLTIQPGKLEPAPVGKCEIYNCKQNGSVSVKGCAMFAPRKGCKVGAYDYTKSYPDCCPREVC